MLNRERTSALVRLGQAGDADAFAELVRAYQDLAVAYATSILGDYHLAEDAAQESFVDAYRALTALREPAAFRGVVPPDRVQAMRSSDAAQAAPERRP